MTITIDIILLIFLGGFIIYGFYRGLVRMLLNLIASILSIIISVRFYDDFFELFSFIKLDFFGMGKIISFTFILIIVSFLLSIVFKIVAKVLKIITSLPVISFFNRMAGGVFGLIQGLFIIGTILFVISASPLLDSSLDFLISNSDISAAFIKAVYWIKPFVPEGLKMARELV